MKTLLVFLCVMTLGFINSYSQTRIRFAIHPLAVGDTVPDVTISNIIHYPLTSVKLSSFKGKLLILDFWFVHCGSCILSFPKNYALQKKYNDRLQILLVDSKITHDNEEKINYFFSRHKQPFYYLPSAINDTVLISLFPHQTCPHCVWIKDNIVKAITYADDVNDQNIESLLKNEDRRIDTKKDIDVDFSKPLFVDKNGGPAPEFIYRSVLSGYLSGLSGVGWVPDDKNRVTDIRLVNSPVMQLYKFAHPEYAGIPHTRFIYNIPNPEDYNIDSAVKKSWRMKNCYTYEATFPLRSKTEALKIMRSDLDRYFHLSIDSIVKEVPCYVIKLNKNIPPPIVPATVKAETNIYEMNAGSSIYFNKQLLYQLTNRLEEIYKIPFVDETGYHKYISLNLPADLQNERSLKDSLFQQGYILTKETRKICFVELSEQK